MGVAVAGVHAPAFVERFSNALPKRSAHASVAGVHAPAFVERRVMGQAQTPTNELSPGFTPRPSLSVKYFGLLGALGAPVAGVHAPAFVERTTTEAARGNRWSVAGVHAPAFVERSASWAVPHDAARAVAGVHAPAFVERFTPTQGPTAISPLSPGFTPRPSLSGARRRRWRSQCVLSPGFTPRPSLSGRLPGDHHGGRHGCRRGSRPGLR